MSDIDYAGMGLTPEEIESLALDSEGNPVLPDDEDVEEDDEYEEAAEAPEEVTAEVETTAEVAAEVAAEPEAEEVVAKTAFDNTFAPVFEAKAVDNYKEVLRQLDEAYDSLTDELAKKYESGASDFSAYRKEERALTREYESRRQEISTANLKAEIATEHSQQSAAQKWALEQSIFYTDNAEFKTDPLLRGALSAQLDLLYSDQNISDKSGLWYLREASRLVNARFGVVSAEVKDTKGDKLVAEAVDKQKKAAAIPLKVVKTLADVPSADADNDDSGEFVYMDKLGGLDYERAIAKMNKEQRSRFMAA